MFAAYQYNPGTNGHVDKFEETLEKMKRQYDISYSFGPTYDDVIQYIL